MAAGKSGGRVEVEGRKELQRAFRKMGGRSSDLKEATRSAVEIVEREAESIVPVLSGSLRDSIRSQAKANSGSVIAGGRRGIVYAGPIHFGWRARNIEPQPFLFDALDHRRDEVVERYRSQVDTIVRRFDTEAPD